MFYAGRTVLSGIGCRRALTCTQNSIYVENLNTWCWALLGVNTIWGARFISFWLHQRIFYSRNLVLGKNSVRRLFQELFINWILKSIEFRLQLMPTDLLCPIKYVPWWFHNWYHWQWSCFGENFRWPSIINLTFILQRSPDGQYTSCGGLSCWANRIFLWQHEKQNLKKGWKLIHLYRIG